MMNQAVTGKTETGGIDMELLQRLRPDSAGHPETVPVRTFDIQKGTGRSGSGDVRNSVRKRGRKRRAGFSLKRASLRSHILLLLAGALVVAFIFGRIAVHASRSGSGDEASYQVITVRYGDTLWGIAGQHASDMGEDIRTYIGNLQEINHLSGDRIREGERLLIYKKP